jgi:hypothetical protein
MNSRLVPCNDYRLQNFLPVTQFAFGQGVADLTGSLGGYFPEFENCCQRFRRGMLRIAGRIDVRGLDAEMASKPINGFLD